VKRGPALSFVAEGSFWRWGEESEGKRSVFRSLGLVLIGRGWGWSWKLDKIVLGASSCNNNHLRQGIYYILQLDKGCLWERPEREI
jgi:hypothetical protein